MKKFLIFGVMCLILVPQVVNAAWWNPFSWKVFSKKEVVSKVQIINTEQTTTQVPQNDILIDSNKKPVEVKILTQEMSVPQKKPTQVVVSTPTISPLATIPTPPVFDVCKNIDGIQSIAPSGMYAESGNCSSINTTQYQNPAIVPSVQLTTTPTLLSIIGLTTTMTEDKATLQWSTSIPSNDRVFLQVNGVKTQVAVSSLSTIHSATLTSLSPSKNYSFTIESIVNDGITNTQYSGTFITKESPVPTYTIDRKDAYGYTYYKESGKNGNFQLDAIIFKLAQVPYKTDGGANFALWHAHNQDNYLSTCKSILEGWQETNKVFPYPCPVDNNNTSLYVGKSRVANYDYNTRNIYLIGYDGYGQSFTEGTEIYYYHATDLMSGKVFEYQAPKVSFQASS